MGCSAFSQSSSRRIHGISILSAGWLFCVGLALALNLGGARAAVIAEDPPEIDPINIPLEDLIKMPIVTPSRFPQTPAEAPASVTIITSDEVKKYGHRTLADVLRSVRGLHVTYNRVDEFLGTRGFNRGDFNSRVLVMVDGHRINNSLTDGALIGEGFVLDVDLVDRVEVVRGPGSVIYGNNAFFGVINVVTRQGKDFPGLGWEFSGEGGDLDTYKGRLSYGHRFTNGLDIILSGSRYESDGERKLFFEEFDSPLTSNGVARDLDRSQFDSLFGSVRYRGFTLQGGYLDRRKDIPTAPENSAFNDPRAKVEDERGYASLRFEEELPGEVTLMANVYYDRSDFSRDLPLAGGFLSEETQVGEWWGAELQLTRELLDRHTLTLGAEYRDDFRQTSVTESDLPGFVPAEQSRSRQSYGVYINGDFALWTNVFHLNAGVRYDQYETFDPSFNPRLALVYRPFEDTVFKAIYGTAFRAPNFRELIDTRFPDIGAEEITSYELVYEQRLGENMRSTLSGFYNQIDDLIVIENGVFGNVDAEAVGFEVGLEGLWEGGVRTRISYTLQDVTREDTGQVLTDAPRHLAKANLIVPLYRQRVFGAVEYQYTASRRTERTLFAGGPQTVAGEEVGGFGVLNLTLFVERVIPGFEFSASVYNVLDKRYSDPSTPGHFQASIPQDGRTFRVKLTFRF